MECPDWALLICDAICPGFPGTERDPGWGSGANCKHTHDSFSKMEGRVWFLFEAKSLYVALALNSVPLRECQNYKQHQVENLGPVF